MVNLLVVSHSYDFAKASVELVSEMKSEDFSLDFIGGIEDGKVFGSDPFLILEKINVLNDEGVLVIADMGSSIMNSQVAISMLSNANQKKVKLVNAPFFEGLLVATTANMPGLTLDDLLVMVEHTKGSDKF